MPTNVLEAKITADVSDLKSKLSEAEKLQQKYGKSIQQTQKDLAENIAISQRYERAISELNAEYKSGAISSKEYSKQLSRLQRDEKETEIETGRLRKELSKLKREQRDLAQANIGSTKSLGGLQKGTANATPSVIEFSRVIQDAPFGIQGVANNIQQLTTNFGYLRTQAGGTLPALKAFASSFVGPTGLIVAVSAITSLLVSYGDEIGGLFGTTNKLTQATKEYIGEARSEITTLKQLVEIATDENNSKVIRQGAIDEINKTYGDYLGNLDLESIKTDAVRKSIDDLTISLIKQAKIKGIQDIIGEQAKETAEDLLDLDIRRKNVVEDIASIEQRQAKATGSDRSRLAGRLSRLRESLSDIDDEIKEVNSSATEALRPFLEIQKTLREDVFELNLSGGDGSVGKDVGDQIREGISKSVSSIKPIGITPLTVNTEIPLQDINTFAETFNSKLLTVQNTAQTLSSAVGSSFSALGSQLASFIGTGNALLDSFVGSIVNSLTQVAAAFIQNQILQSVVARGQILSNQAKSNANAVTIATSAAAALGPAGAIALPGIIASQLAIVNGAFAGIQAIPFAQGGIVPGGSFSGDKVPAFLNSGEVVMNGRQQSETLMAIANGNAKNSQQNAVDITFVLKGSDLVGSVNRTIGSNGRRGGNLRVR